MLPWTKDEDHPVCVAYNRDSPVECCCEGDPEEPEPFNLAEANRGLAALSARFERPLAQLTRRSNLI